MSFAFFHSFFKKEIFFYQDQISTMLMSMPGTTQNFNIIDDYALGSTLSNSNIFKLNNTLIILDGFIFNSEELSKTYNIFGTTDAEIIIKLYDKFGFQKTISLIDGELTIVILDLKSKVLYLSRDKLGIKPAYYHVGKGFMSMASKPIAIVKLKNFKTEINKKYLALQLGSHYRTFDNDVDASPFLNLSQLPASSYMEFNIHTKKFLINKYWNIKSEFKLDISEKNMIDDYRSILFNSLNKRLKKIKKPAFTLSGGMDSSSILCSSSKILQKPQVAFSSVYKDPTYDERNEIEDVISKSVSKWHTVELGNEIDLIENIRNLVRIHNEPVATATWLSHFLLSKDIKLNGFDSLFGGLGGDELNAGEYEYFPVFFADLLKQKKNSKLNKEIKLWSKYHNHPIHIKNEDMAYELIKTMTEQNSNGICKPNLERQTKYRKAVNVDYFDLTNFNPIMEHPFEEFLLNRCYQDLTRETTPCCLRAEDRHCTYFGLEKFDPFLDYELVQFLFKVPGEMKIKDGITKYLLRKTMKDILPKNTVNRIKKTGWNAPAHIWFSGKYLNTIRDLVSSSTVKNRDIYNIEFIKDVIDEHEYIVENNVNKENHMMFLWQFLNVESFFDWVETELI